MRTENGDQVVDVQRGTVTAVNSQSITVRSEDVFSGTYATDPQTKIRKDRKSASPELVISLALQRAHTGEVIKLGVATSTAL